MQPKRHESKIILTLEGNIGAGKSTFLNIIDSLLEVNVVPEPTNRWQGKKGEENLLDLFYKDTKRWAYTFQSFAFISRIQEQEENLKKLPSNAIQILERSVYCDRYCFAANCFDMDTMTPLEWNMYIEWFAWLVTAYTTKPDGFIYLQTQPKVCAQRMQKRNRSEESAVPLSYLQAIHTKHERWLLHTKTDDTLTADIPVLVLSCDDDFENDAQLQQAHATKVAAFIADLRAHKQLLSKQKLKATITKQISNQ